MDFSNYRFSRTHEWATTDSSGQVVVGITKHAVELLNDLVHVELPKVGAAVKAGEGFGEVESVKAVSDVIAPLSGEVLAVNQKAVDEPETVNADPYGEGWLVRIRVGDPAEAEALMDAEAYRAHLAEL